MKHLEAKTQVRRPVRPGGWLLMPLFLSASLGLAEAAAADPDDFNNANPADSPGPQELKSLVDPTILLRRLWLDTEWNQFSDGHHDIQSKLGGMWSWRISDRQDWAVQLSVPMAWHLAGDMEGDTDKEGLGDIEVATGTAFHLGKFWRTGGGLELKTPSATDNVLGDDVWKLKPFWAVAWDVAPKLTFSPKAEYNASVAEERGASPQNFLEMYLPATYAFPHGWSLSARYETKVDFEHSNEWTHSAKLVLARELRRVPLAFALSIKKSFDGGDKDFQINLVATYFFRQRKPQT